MNYKKKIAFAVVFSPIIIFISLVLLIAGKGLIDDEGKADVAIVFGNKVNFDGSPSKRLKARLDKSLELFVNKKVKFIIVSGGTGMEGHDESAVMKDYLVKNGVPDNNIIADPKGNNTYLTAKNAAEIMKKMKFKSAAVVTQYYHVPRCTMTMRKFNITPVYSYHAEFFEIRDIYSICRELAAIITYQFKDYN